MPANTDTPAPAPDDATPQVFRIMRFSTIKNISESPNGLFLQHPDGSVYTQAPSRHEATDQMFTHVFAMDGFSAMVVKCILPAVVHGQSGSEIDDTGVLIRDDEVYEQLLAKHGGSPGADIMVVAGARSDTPGVTVVHV